MKTKDITPGMTLIWCDRQGGPEAHPYDCRQAIVIGIWPAVLAEDPKITSDGWRRCKYDGQGISGASKSNGILISHQPRWAGGVDLAYSVVPPSQLYPGDQATIDQIKADRVADQQRRAQAQAELDAKNQRRDDAINQAASAKLGRQVEFGTYGGGYLVGPRTLAKLLGIELPD